MKWFKSAIIAGLIITMIMPLHSCKTVPVTERRQFVLVNNKRLQKKYIQDYYWDITHGTLAVGTTGDIMVKTAGAKMIPVYEEILLEAGRTKELKHHQWEFNVLVRDLPMAYAIPGGKVMFYSALIPVCKDEDGVAFVMGHELGHVLANHYCEGHTKQELGELAMFTVLTLASGGNLDYEVIEMISFSTIFLVRAAFNYKNEMEADRLGLILMARAGYNPETAVSYLERYDSLKKHVYSIDMTEKDSLRRAELILNYLPQAKEYYNDSVQ